MAWVMQDPKATTVTLSLIIYESASYESILSPPKGRMREHREVYAGEKKKKKKEPSQCLQIRRNAEFSQNLIGCCINLPPGLPFLEAHR